MSLQRAFSVSVERRRPVGEPANYIVGGNCSQTFGSLHEARLFVLRENHKYQNGALRPFVPTHAILWQPVHSPRVKRLIPVMMVDVSERKAGDPAALYTRDEWKPCTVPQWSYIAALGYLMLDDYIMGVSWKVLPYEEAFANFAVFTATDSRDRARFFAW